MWSKGAALLQSIVKNHALVDGNRRLGWLATAVFLEINGVDTTSASDDAVYDLVIDVAAADHKVDEIAARLRSTLSGATWQSFGGPIRSHRLCGGSPVGGDQPEIHPLSTTAARNRW